MQSSLMAAVPLITTLAGVTLAATISHFADLQLEADRSLIRSQQAVFEARLHQAMQEVR